MAGFNPARGAIFGSLASTSDGFSGAAGGRAPALIQSLIVEGGAEPLQAFIKANLWDEARVFVSPQTFGKGVKAPLAPGMLHEQHKLKSDWLKIYKPHTA